MTNKHSIKLETTTFPGLGLALRKVRESRSLSVSEWGKRLGLAQGTVSKYEKGDLNVPIDVLERIAKEVEQPPDVVLAYLLRERYPRIASSDSDLGVLVEEFTAELEL